MTCSETDLKLAILL